MSQNPEPSERILPSSLARQMRIEQICDRFEAAWKAGQRPRIEDFLAEWSEAPLTERAQLLRELVELELDYRGREGERPIQEEYLSWFPEHKTVIGRLLADRNVPGGEPSGTTVRPDNEADSVPAPEAEAARTWPAVPGYEILEKLGEGGQGTVYKARQVGLGRLVALKTVRWDRQESPDYRSRFLTEAKIVAQLKHPNIVQVYDAGEVGSTLYYSMELTDGTDLSEKIVDMPLASLDSARLVEALARAMQVAHQAGIVHRDLKPRNVLTLSDGTPKICDFGLAKHLDPEIGVKSLSAVAGTTPYMAPEQVAGQQANVRFATDVWSLGVILYELLTQTRPFTGPTPHAIYEQILFRDPVPVRVLQPQTSRDLETICLKCLQKDPAKRYRDAGALADDLHRFLNGDPILARPVSRLEKAWRWCRRNPGLAVSNGLTVVSLLALAIVATERAFKYAEDAEIERQRRRDEEQKRLGAERERLSLALALLGADPRGPRTSNPTGESQQELVNSMRRYVFLNPVDTEAQHELANAYYWLGMYYRESGETDKQREAWIKSAAVSKAAATHANPDIQFEYTSNLGRTYFNLGVLAQNEMKDAEQIEFMTKAIDTLNPLFTKKAADNLKWFLIESHLARASAFLRQERYAEALRDSREALVLADGERKEQIRLHLLAPSLAWNGEYESAIQEGEAGIKALGKTGENLYTLAVTYGLAAEKDSRHADRALALLKEAQSAGYFKDQKKVEQLRDSKAFGPAVRNLQGFHELMREISP